MKKILLFIFAILYVTTFCDAKRTFSKKSSSISNQQTQQNIVSEEIVIDFDTGETLFEKNADQVCVPSSMTKIMTIYLVFEALENGIINLDDMVQVSEYAKSKEGSRSFFEAGTWVKIEDLIRSVVVHSGNDGCTVLAEKLAGDEAAFAGMMNVKAEEFGLQNTHFMNSTGLPEENHYSTVRDLAIISQRIIRDFPQYYHYFSEKTFTANGITQPNRNVLLGNSLNVDGLKTGKTKLGGCGIVISAKNNGKRLIVVVNGCPSEKLRSIEANKMLAVGFQEYISVKIADKEQPIGKANVLFGKRENIDVYCCESISTYIPKKYKNSLVVELDIKEPIEAPIAVNDKLGTLVYKYNNYVSKKYDICSREYVEKVGVFKRLLLKIISLFTDSVKKYGNNIDAPIGIKSI